MPEQLLVGQRKRLAHALHERVDRARRELGPEQVARELDRVAAGDAVSDRERGDRRLQARAEGATWHLGGKLGARAGGAGRAAQPVQAMLGHRDREPRQLGDLVALGRRRVDAPVLAEVVRAGSATLGPAVDDLVHPLERKQRPAPALVSGLAALRSARARPARPRRCRGRILGGRKRGVARAPGEAPLELGDTGLQASVRLDQLADPHQQRDRRLPVAVEDRLCLGPLHTDPVRRPKRGPCLQK